MTLLRTFELIDSNRLKRTELLKQALEAAQAWGAEVGARVKCVHVREAHAAYRCISPEIPGAFQALEFRAPAYMIYEIDCYGEESTPCLFDGCGAHPKFTWINSSGVELKLCDTHLAILKHVVETYEQIDSTTYSVVVR